MHEITPECDQHNYIQSGPCMGHKLKKGVKGAVIRAAPQQLRLLGSEARKLATNSTEKYGYSYLGFIR